MTKYKILFLGGAYAQIPMIKEAKRRGFHIITCDYLPNNPGHQLADEYYNVSTTNTEEVLEIVRKHKPDFVYAYASDPAAPVAAYVSEHLGLPGNPYRSVQIMSEKDLFREFLQKNGFNSPKAITLTSFEDIEESMNRLQFPIIVKPTDSSGSKGVTKVEDASNLTSAIKYALSFSRNKRIIAEEFIDNNGEQIHGDGFVINGKLVFTYLGDHHYNRRINPFVPYATTWPSKNSPETMYKVDQELRRFISLSGYKNGPINIEVRIGTNAEVYIMEIGPRSGGNFVPQAINYATGFDMVAASLDVLGNTEVMPSVSQGKAAAYYVVHSESDGILVDLFMSEQILPFIKEFHQYVSPGEEVKSFHGANAALGVLLLVFDNSEEMDYYISNMDAYIDLKVEEALVWQ